MRQYISAQNGRSKVFERETREKGENIRKRIERRRGEGRGKESEKEKCPLNWKKGTTATNIGSDYRTECSQQPIFERPLPDIPYEFFSSV